MASRILEYSDMASSQPKGGYWIDPYSRNSVQRQREWERGFHIPRLSRAVKLAEVEATSRSGIWEAENVPSPRHSMCRRVPQHGGSNAINLIYFETAVGADLAADFFTWGEEPLHLPSNPWNVSDEKTRDNGSSWSIMLTFLP
jgi:hypothetical protein